MTDWAPAPKTPTLRHRLREPGRLFSTRPLARLRSECGTAVVEFALVALPLCLILFGILDFGRALNYYNDLTQIAGQGARAAAVNQDPNGGAADANFQNQLKAEATSAELQNGIQVCTIGTAPVNPGDPVTVRATFQFHFIPLVRSADITLSATQTERFESTNPSFSQGCSS